MTLDSVKSFIKSNVNKNLNFKYNGSRNQVVKFSGKIVNIYPCVFIIRSNDNDFVRSFAYSDVLIGNLEIK